MNLHDAFLSVMFRTGLILFFPSKFADAFEIEFIRQNRKILDRFD